MPSVSKIAALACAAASAAGGAHAFVQPGAPRATSQPRASAPALRRWQPSPEAEAQTAAEGLPAKGFLAGLALGLGVALAGAQGAQAEAAASPAKPAAPAKAAPKAAAAPAKAAPKAAAKATPAKAAPAKAKKVLTDIRDKNLGLADEKGYFDTKEFDKQRDAIAKNLNKKDKDGISLQTWKFGKDYDKKYTQSSTGTGTFLRYNLGNYQVIPSYRGSPKDDGTYTINPRQIELAKAKAAENERILKEVAPKWLKDGGSKGNIWPSQGMYKPRYYTSTYTPVRQEKKSSLELAADAAKPAKGAAKPAAKAAAKPAAKPAAAPAVAPEAAKAAKPAAKPAA